MRIGRTIAVSTGPKIRGACDDEIFRLFVTRRSGNVTLTSYRYGPIIPKAAGTCAGIALPPYVAAVTVDFDPPASVVDGSRSPRPLTQVLLPTAIPAEFVFQQPNQEFPQMADPAQPAFLASTSQQGKSAQAYRYGTRSLSVRQGIESFASGLKSAGTTTVGEFAAGIFLVGGSPDHCIRWTDKAAGKMEVCGNISGGADALLAVARSIYPD